MDKAAREKAREPVSGDEIAESLRRNYEVALQKAHDAPRDGDAWARWSNEASRAKQRLDAHTRAAASSNSTQVTLDAAESDNARLQARVSELEAALAKAENILARNLGHQTEKRYDALEIIRNGLFPGLALPAPPVGDR